MKKLIDIDMSNVKLSKEAKERLHKRHEMKSEKLTEMKRDYENGKFDDQIDNL